jgi:hypothetical protein
MENTIICSICQAPGPIAIHIQMGCSTEWQLPAAAGWVMITALDHEGEHDAAKLERGMQYGRGR